MTNREIKFRAWNKKRKVLAASFSMKEIYDLNNGSIIKNKPLDDYQNYVVMQYTGLKDKNGKEIYEGDVVRETEEGFPEDILGTYVIEYEGNGFWPKDRDNESGFSTNGYGTEFEVIGNIYEHSHLLDHDPQV